MRKRTSNVEVHSLEPLPKESTTPTETLLPGELLVDLSGTRYRLTTSLSELANAEEYYNRQGRMLNVLHSFAALNLATTRTLWVCALYRYQPEIGYDEAMALLTPPAALMVGGSFAEIISKAIQDSAKTATNAGL